MSTSIKSLLREPLVHFLVLGAALFFVYGFLKADDGAESSHEIALTYDELAQLQILFESQWRRSPSPEEFAAMVENNVRQEVLYREALAIGLDKNDEIVKRRMAQKMQFLAEDLAAAYEPTSEELKAWFTENSEMFAMPSRVGFQHLYFSPDRRGGLAYEDALLALAELAGEPVDSKAAESIADPFMFQDYYADRTPETLAKDFGPQFAMAVPKLTPHSWQGPVESGYGWHLVYVDSLVPGRVPGFEEIEREVKTAWLSERKEAAWKKAYQDMRSKYTLLLPVPPDDAEETEVGAAPSTTDSQEQGR